MTLPVTAAVDPAYRHVDKVAEPTGVVGRMKWYDLREADHVIDPAARDAARASVDALIDPGDVGFVILHLCGADVLLLLVCRWRNDNEIWETVFVNRGDGAFTMVAGDDPSRATYCVWELGVVDSERLAWAGFLRGARDEEALDGYLADTCSGVV